MYVGYARVSSRDQDLSTQLDQLKAAGCERIFSEKISGSGTESRIQLQELLKFVRDTDTVVITKVDRIARNVSDALSIADQIKTKRAGFKILQLGDLDIFGTTMGKFFYTNLCMFAEMEREFILERQREGLLLAKQRGKTLGRPKVLKPDMVQRIKELMSTLDNQREVADMLGISRTTVRKAIRM